MIKGHSNFKEIVFIKPSTMHKDYTLTTTKKKDVRIEEKQGKHSLSSNDHLVYADKATPQQVGLVRALLPASGLSWP